MQILRGALGIAVILAICFALSRNRRAVSLRLVAAGLGLQVALGFLIFRTEAGAALFRALATFVTRVLEFSYDGTAFVFGSLGQKGAPSCLAFQALPIVIYFSALTALLYHFGILQVIVLAMARVLGTLLRVSGAESMVVAANVFVGMTEAPLVVRPYIEAMTRSELMALMTGGFATIAGTVMGIYMVFVGPAYASYILAASVMAAPAAFVTAKIILPETEESRTGASFRPRLERPARNALDAISTGVRDGLQLALNIAAMLIAFYAIIGLLNWPLEAWFGVTIQKVLGWLLAPFAWCLGVDWGEARMFGSLLGTKVVVNEWVGYQELQTMIQASSLSDRAVKIATFALCGFANFGSIGVTLGGVGQLAPSRRGDLAQMALPAMVAGALSSCMTAAIAGMLL